MLRRADRLIDKMPFSGKLLLEPTLKGYVKSTPGHERLKFGGTSLLLGTFAVAHAIEAKFGVTTFVEQLQHFEQTADLNDESFLAIDATYAATMAAVSLRQLRLMGAANRIRQHRKSRIARQRMQEHSQAVDTPDASLTETTTGSSVTPAVAEKRPPAFLTYMMPTKKRLSTMALATLVTGGGQLAMMQSSNYAAHEACITNANNDLSADQASHMPRHDEEILRGEWIDFCGASPTDIRPLPPQHHMAIPITKG